MELITHRGRVAAVAGASRAYLAPHVDALADQHPVKQFVLEPCLYAHRLAHGALDGGPPRYLPGRAERYVREQRMPAELFRVRVTSATRSSPRPSTCPCGRSRPGGGSCRQ